MSVEQIFDEIEFVGEISLAKTSAACILLGLGLEHLLNSTVNDQIYFRWLFEPWGTPLRLTLGIVTVVGIILIARRVLQSALRIPAIEVRHGIVRITCRANRKEAARSIFFITFLLFGCDGNGGGWQRGFIRRSVSCLGLGRGAQEHAAHARGRFKNRSHRFCNS